MEESIEASGHVLVICTPEYAKRANARRGGVGYEQQIISGHIMQGVPRKKFIPILKNGEFEPGPACGIPTHFAGIYALDMRTSYRLNKNFEQLLRVIYNKPKLRPPTLGPRTPWATSRARKIASKVALQFLAQLFQSRPVHFCPAVPVVNVFLDEHMPRRDDLALQLDDLALDRLLLLLPLGAHARIQGGLCHTP
jgi:hypothetical protein